jgi:hypothetical protein
MPAKTIFVSMLIAIGASPLAGQSACPTLTAAERAEAAETVEIFLTHAQFEGLRQQHAVPALDASHIRVLADSTDANACRQIRAGVTNPGLLAAPWREVLLAVDGYYFEVFLKAPVEQTRFHTEGDRIVGQQYMVPFAMFRPDLSVIFADLI